MGQQCVRHVLYGVFVVHSQRHIIYTPTLCPPSVRYTSVRKWAKGSDGADAKYIYCKRTADRMIEVSDGTLNFALKQYTSACFARSDFALSKPLTTRSALVCVCLQIHMRIACAPCCVPHTQQRPRTTHAAYVVRAQSQSAAF